MLTILSPLSAKTLLGLHAMHTRAGSQFSALQSRLRIDTKVSALGTSGVWKTEGPKTSSEIRMRSCISQNVRRDSSCVRVKQRPSGLWGFEIIRALTGEDELFRAESRLSMNEAASEMLDGKTGIGLTLARRREKMS